MPRKVYLDKNLLINKGQNKVQQTDRFDLESYIQEVSGTGLVPASLVELPSGVGVPGTTFPTATLSIIGMGQSNMQGEQDGEELETIAYHSSDNAGAGWPTLFKNYSGSNFYLNYTSSQAPTAYFGNNASNVVRIAGQNQGGAYNHPDGNPIALNSGFIAWHDPDHINWIVKFGDNVMQSGNVTSGFYPHLFARGGTSQSVWMGDSGSIFEAQGGLWYVARRGYENDQDGEGLQTWSGEKSINGPDWVVWWQGENEALDLARGTTLSNFDELKTQLRRVPDQIKEFWPNSKVIIINPVYFIQAGYSEGSGSISSQDFQDAFDLAEQAYREIAAELGYVFLDCATYLADFVTYGIDSGHGTPLLRALHANGTFQKAIGDDIWDIVQNGALSITLLEATVEVGELLPVDTSSLPTTVTAPTTNTPGAMFAVSDVGNNASVNNITVNFDTFYGTASGSDTISTNNASVKYMWVNATTGWIIAP
jgi:hypothetical protein